MDKNCQIDQSRYYSGELPAQGWGKTIKFFTACDDKGVFFIGLSASGRSGKVYKIRYDLDEQTAGDPHSRLMAQQTDDLHDTMWPYAVAVCPS